MWRSVFHELPKWLQVNQIKWQLSSQEKLPKYAPGKLIAIFWFGFPPGNPNPTSDFVIDGMG